MKPTVLILFLFIFTQSCSEDESLSILTADVDGQSITLGNTVAAMISDYDSDQLVRYTYDIQSAGDFVLVMKAYDSLASQSVFTEEDMIAYVSTNGKFYEMEDAELTLNPQGQDILNGSFRMKLRNSENALDSIMIENGSFELSLSRSRRYY